MKAWKIISLFLLIVGIGASSASAQIVPCPPCPPDAPCPMTPCRRPPGGVVTNPESLRIDHHTVNVQIDNQIAHTTIDMKFVNDGNTLAEGTWVFPLPLGASVDSLTMYINDTPIEAQILDARQARDTYNSIVRQLRDPALLQYVGTQAVQANIFPIPPGETRRISLSYSQVLSADNGLIHYVYPFDVTKLTSNRPVDEASINVEVNSNDSVSSIYSPSHNIVISRATDTDKHFRVGWEQTNYTPDQDFSLYYGIATKTINVNLLTYRESASEDGFFMLLVQPPIRPIETLTVVQRDIIVVLDQSGSMDGDKWKQAQQAADYVLNHLNPGDRFNVILFSTGWRIFSNNLEQASSAQDAVNWINGMYAEGGTDINGALTTALGMADPERPTTLLFMTDGLPTEGETDPKTILANVDAAAKPNVSIFTFGVGDDVNTFLLELAGAGSSRPVVLRPPDRTD